MDERDIPYHIIDVHESKVTQIEKGTVKMLYTRTRFMAIQ